MSKEFPRWAAEEITKAAWRYIEEWTGSGYILDVDQEQRLVDVQFFERLPEGRHIVTLEVPDGYSWTGMEPGEAFIFRFKVYKADLAERLVSYLVQEYSVKIDSIYRFVLVSAEALE